MEKLSKLEQGAHIIINNWMEIDSKDSLLIITSEDYMDEALELKRQALKKKASVDIQMVEETGIKVGVYFDENENIFDNYTAVIGAAEYSIVTTRAVKRVIKRGNKFLSLPLSVSGEKSMLEYDFIRMNMDESEEIAHMLINHIEKAKVIHVKTSLGTDIKVYKENRNPGYFNGRTSENGRYASASFEVYIPIEETKTEGTMVVDGSLGYIGRPDQPTEINFTAGKISKIEESESGKKLKEYIEGYNDSRMYVASEFGIGTNKLSKCEGSCYIEDESAYGTFHIGFGRNIALGGNHEASGHFDLVSLEPNIYADGVKIMNQGEIIDSDI